MTCVPADVCVELTPPQAVPATRALLWGPPTDTPRAGLVLGHGAGGDVGDAVLHAVGSRAAAAGHAVLAFNFAYAEAGRRRPDPSARLESAFRDVVREARRRFGDRPLVLGGRSMGGRIASHLAAQDPAGRYAALVLLGYPLQPPGTAGGGEPAPRLRSGHWPDLRLPVLFVQGDRDRLCDLDLLERERRTRLGGAVSTVHVCRGADHSFGMRRRDGRTRAEVLDEVAGTVVTWLANLAAPAASPATSPVASPDGSPAASPDGSPAASPDQSPAASPGASPVPSPVVRSASAAP